MLSRVYIAANTASITANVRTSPLLTSKIVRTINSVGEVAKLKSTVDGWAEYEFNDASSGWVSTTVHAYTAIPEDVKLNVAYVSQNDKDADSHVNDCGIACTAMFLRPDVTETVEKLAFSVGMNFKSLTRISDITTLLTRHKVEHRYVRPLNVVGVVNAIKTGFGVIALVNYKYVAPPKSFPHFMNVYGMNVENGTFDIHDPYNELNTSISFQQLGKAMLGASEQGNMAWQGVVVRAKVAVP